MHFTHYCGATLLLLKPAKKPIFSSDEIAGVGPELKKETAMFTNLVRLIRQWKRYNNSIDELSRLGDRELADIGISRSDIPRVSLERRTTRLSRSATGI